MRGLATSYMRRKLSAAAVLGRWEIVPRNCSPWGLGRVEDAPPVNGPDDGIEG